jgi:hypothetical protein
LIKSLFKFPIILRDGRTKAKLTTILTVAYFYEQVRRADREIGGLGDGVVGFLKIFHCFCLRSRKKFLID